MAISTTTTSVVSSTSSSVSGTPISLLRLAWVGDDARHGPQQRRQDVFGGRLAGAAGDADDLAPWRGCATALASRASAASPSSTTMRGASGGSAAAERTTAAAAPRSSACAANASPSKRSPRNADEQVAGPDRSRVGAHARQTAAGSPPSRRPRADLGDVGERELKHPLPLPQQLGEQLFGHGAVVEGDTGSPIFWPCSCPLPAMTTTSPARASRSASPMAARRSGSTATWPASAAARRRRSRR